MTDRVKAKYLKNIRTVLADFNIEVTTDIWDKLSEMYPNEIAIERYTRTLILNKLERGEGK